MPINANYDEGNHNEAGEIVPDNQPNYDQALNTSVHGITAANTENEIFSLAQLSLRTSAAMEGHIIC